MKVHLVRRLLGLLLLRNGVGHVPLNVCQNDQRDAKPALNSGFGRSIAIDNQAGKTNGQHAVNDAYLRNDFDTNRLNGNWLGDLKIVASEQNRALAAVNSGFVGHLNNPPLEGINKHAAAALESSLSRKVAA